MARGPFCHRSGMVCSLHLYGRDHQENTPVPPLLTLPHCRDVYNLQTSSVACGYCTTPLDLSSPRVLACSASTSASYCPYRFCNRLCLSRSAIHHPLLCPAQNPASVPLLSLAKETQWMALHALAQVASRLLLVGQRSEEDLLRDWTVVESWAGLGMEERFKYSFDQ